MVTLKKNIPTTCCILIFLLEGPFLFNRYLNLSIEPFLVGLVQLRVLGILEKMFLYFVHWLTCQLYSYSMDSIPVTILYSFRMHLAFSYIISFQLKSDHDKLLCKTMIC